MYEILTSSSNHLNFADSRSSPSQKKPQDYVRGVWFEFIESSKINTPFGNYYTTLITFRSYGNGTDMSGGGVIQLALATNQLKIRYSASATSWSSWYNPNGV